MQQNPPPLSGSAAATGLYSTHRHNLYADHLYSPYYPQPQNPNPNPNSNPFRSYCSNSLNTLLQPPGLDQNSTLNINPYANASSTCDSHQLGFSCLHPQAVTHDPNAIDQQLPVNSFGIIDQIAGLQKNSSWKNSPKKVKVVQSAWCEVCKVNCNSKSVLHLHKLGNKHKKNLQKLGVGNSSVLPAWCEVCKVGFNSKIVLDQHKLGKKHKKNLEKLIVVNSSVPLAWCEVCKLDYNSKTVLDQHKLGKKHKKNLEKVTPANSSVLQAPAPELLPASVPPASAVVDNPAIGPGEKPGESTPASEQKTQKKEVGAVDLETKKRKVLEGGAAAEAVRICPACNVVCNSETVFKHHLAGQKHAAMMKQHASTSSTAAAT